MSKEISAKKVTVQELVTVFKGKFVDISPVDHYGISINMRKATLEMEGNNPELYFVNRNEDNHVINSICIAEDSIESIEGYEDGTYTVNFSLDMTSVNIRESRM